VLDASVSERGGRRFAGSGSTLVGPVRLTAYGLHEVSDGYIPVRGDQAGAADTPLDLETRAASLRADAPVAGAVLSLRASTWEEERGSGLLQTRANASGHALSATLAKSPVAGGYGWRLQAWRIESNLANTSASVSDGRVGTTLVNDQFKTPATGWGLNAALRRGAQELFGGTVQWELGADGRFNEGETNERFGLAFTPRGREAGGETSVYGGYVDASWKDDNWLLAGGLRLDHWSNQSGFRREYLLSNGAVSLDETDPDRSGDVLSARAAVRRDLSGLIGEGYSWRAAAYSGFRPATLNELHRPFRVGDDITEANAALQPETLKGIETGLAYERSGLSWGATVFWNQIEDAIVNVTLGQGPATFPRAGFIPAGGVLRQRQNAGTIEAKGVELTARQALRGGLTLNGAL
ncbi:hypothetical protein LTR94_026963, partial [Friedmanniomyces endolithicus]